MKKIVKSFGISSVIALQILIPDRDVIAAKQLISPKSATTVKCMILGQSIF